MNNLKLVYKKDTNTKFQKNEAALYPHMGKAPLRIIFAWFTSDDSIDCLILKRVRKFIIRMKLEKDYNFYDENLMKRVFNDK